MNNPFKNHTNSNKLIAGLALGSIFAGAITYLYIKRKSDINAEANHLKKQAKNYIKQKSKKGKKIKALVG